MEDKQIETANCNNIDASMQASECMIINDMDISEVEKVLRQIEIFKGRKKNNVNGQEMGKVDVLALNK